MTTALVEEERDGYKKKMQRGREDENGPQFRFGVGFKSGALHSPLSKMSSGCENVASVYEVNMCSD